MECSNCGDVGCHHCDSTDVKKELIHLSTSFDKTKFIINGCGKFGESKKILTKTEAALLYIELHKFLINSI
jgi:hypothetical protein